MYHPYIRANGAAPPTEMQLPQMANTSGNASSSLTAATERVPSANASANASAGSYVRQSATDTSEPPMPAVASAPASAPLSDVTAPPRPSAGSPLPPILSPPILPPILSPPILSPPPPNAVPPPAPSTSPPPLTSPISATPPLPLLPPPSPPPTSQILPPPPPPSPSPPQPQLVIFPPLDSSGPTVVSPLPSTMLPGPTNPSASTSFSSDNSSSTATPSSSSMPNSTESTSIPSISSGSSSSGSRFPVGAVVGGATVAVVLTALFAVMIVLVSKRKKRRNNLSIQYQSPPNAMALKPDVYSPKPQESPSPVGSSYGLLSYLPESGGAKSRFAYEELKDITNGFSQENLLGQGGFGCVYKGCLPDGRTVAVKQLKVGGGQGEREFRAEVEIISRVHHRHLVSLVGYCIADHDRMLVYEYVPNKTLEYHLHGKGLPVMNWSKRVKIAIGSAHGLAYLHEDCHPRIIHRDIKSANILLDVCFEAQVADFGLAKLTDDMNTHVSTRVMGTFGYMAPEYASSGKLTDRSDVFSFGVVLLELITGRKPVDSLQPLGDESLVEWARPILVRTLETGDCEEIVDPRLENNFAKNEMLMMIEAAAACVRHNASKRPRMVQVVRALDSMGDMPDLSNGMKYGDSTVYNSRQYSDEIGRFQRGAFASSEFSSEFGPSREHERRISISSTKKDPDIP